MRVSEARALLTELASSIRSADTEVGVRNHTSHDSAYLKLTSRTDPGDFAVVWTPGDRWFSLEIAGGFSNDLFGEDYEDAEIREILQHQVNAAVDYIAGRRALGHSPFFKIPFVSVETVEGTLTLHLGFRNAVRHVLGRRRNPADRL